MQTQQQLDSTIVEDSNSISMCGSPRIANLRKRHSYTSSSSCSPPQYVQHFRRPRPLSFVENEDGSLGFDSPSQRAVQQDIIGLKTLLFRLQNVLQNVRISYISIINSCFLFNLFFLIDRLKRKIHLNPVFVQTVHHHSIIIVTDHVPMARNNRSIMNKPIRNINIGQIRRWYNVYVRRHSIWNNIFNYWNRKWLKKIELFVFCNNKWYCNDRLNVIILIKYILG